MHTSWSTVAWYWAIQSNRIEEPDFFRHVCRVALVDAGGSVSVDGSSALFPSQVSVLPRDVIARTRTWRGGEGIQRRTASRGGAVVDYGQRPQLSFLLRSLRRLTTFLEINQEHGSSCLSTEH
jgi:hypothetical protein